MTKGITYNEIEIIVNEHLIEMFNPKANIGNATKETIKQEALKLAQLFIDIVTTFNTNVDQHNYVDSVLNKMDLFVSAYEQLLNAITNKTVASSVGAIWYAFFTSAHDELKDNISDKMLFQYGENRINKVLLERIRR
jgi:hypothetical protein